MLIFDVHVKILFPSVNKSRGHVLGHKGTLRNTPKMPEFWHQRKFLFRNFGRSVPVRAIVFIASVQLN